MTALSADATSMAGLLTALTQPDTEAIRQAEGALKPILKDPRSVPALVEILKAKDTQVGCSDLDRLCYKDGLCMLFLVIFQTF